MTSTQYLEFPLEVQYSAYPFRNGSRDSYGVPLEPDEPSYIEIEDVLLNNISIVHILTDKEINKLITDIEATLMDEYEPEYEGHYYDI